jgi:predicted TIM-barrel fold metal-dependent hydrolase
MALAPLSDEVLPLSADAHVNEPHNLWWERLPAELRDFAPRRIEQGDDGGWSLVINGDARGWQRVSKEREEELEAERIGHATPEVRLSMMAEDGIAGEVIYPTIGLYVWDIHRPDVGAAACRVYNDWIREQLGSRADRIKLAGMIPNWNLDDAVAEVEYVADKGFAAAMLPIVGAPPWNDPQYERLWDAIDRTGMTVVMHQGTGQGDTDGGVVYRGPGSPGANILTAQTQAPRTAALLASSGTLERHPDMHVVLVEVNGGWLAWCMEVLDEFARADPKWQRPALRELPSHYISRQIHCTFQNDPVAIANLELTGSQVLMWGNDYPHDEGTYPASKEIIEKLFAGVAEEDRHRILTGNTATIFGFDEVTCRTPVDSAG